MSCGGPVDRKSTVKLQTEEFENAEDMVSFGK